MKIIKYGKRKPVRKCTYCECVFSYNDQDIKKVISYTGHVLEFVACPVCGILHRLPEEGALPEEE